MIPLVYGPPARAGQLLAYDSQFQPKQPRDLAVNPFTPPQ
jgi:hypothetical protein